MLQRVEQCFEGVVDVALAAVGRVERHDHTHRAGQHGPTQRRQLCARLTSVRPAFAALHHPAAIANTDHAPGVIDARGIGQLDGQRFHGGTLPLREGDGAEAANTPASPFRS